MGIPIGKLSLYSLIGGIHPTRTLPIVLDVWHQQHRAAGRPRIPRLAPRARRGAKLLRLHRPVRNGGQGGDAQTLLQWEDFATPHARPILERYRDELLTFNDDIQGTAAVALGAISAAIKVAAKRDAGAVSRLFGRRVGGDGRGRLPSARHGCRRPLARGCAAALLDRRSRWLAALGANRPHAGAAPLRPARRAHRRLAAGRTWKDRAGRGHREHRSHHPDRPVHRGRRVHRTDGARDGPQGSASHHISVVEPDGKVGSRSGGPHPMDRGTRLDRNGLALPTGRVRQSTHTGCQCNNVFIFPAVGLGVIASGARRVTDQMLLAAGRALGEQTPALGALDAPLLPAIRDLRRIAVESGGRGRRRGAAPGSGARLDTGRAAPQRSPSVSGSRPMTRLRSKADATRYAQAVEGN